MVVNNSFIKENFDLFIDNFIIVIRIINFKDTYFTSIIIDFNYLSLDSYYFIKINSAHSIIYKFIHLLQISFSLTYSVNFKFSHYYLEDCFLTFISFINN